MDKLVSLANSSNDTRAVIGFSTSIEIAPLSAGGESQRVVSVEDPPKKA